MRWPRFRITERQVLLWIMAGLFLAYAATFIVASFRQRAEPVTVNQPPRVRRMPPPTSSEPDIRYWFEDMFDPSLMALPNLQGFSRDLWNRGPVAKLAPSDWNIRPAFLPASPPDRVMVLLGEPALTQIVETLAEKRPATETSTNTGTAFVPGTVTNSFLSVVEGTLTGRWLLSRVSLPAVTNDTPLRPTRVRVAVSPDGAVQFANVERSCGNEAVDAQAVNYSRQLQFTPLTVDTGNGGSEMIWGVVRFAWMTISPPATNHVVKPSLAEP